jgi:HEAT repeat protein
MGRKGGFCSGAVLFGVTLLLITGWMLYPRERMFRGKPERAWMQNVAYWGDDQQTKLWRSFGPEGVRALARALEADNGPMKRTYRKFYRKFAYRLPRGVSRLLPSPDDKGYETRMKAASLLGQLGKDAEPALPALKRALRDLDGVRMIATSCFKPFLEEMSLAEERKLLPEFMRGIGDSNSGIRNNTAIVLKHFREDAAVVAPALVKALQDSHPQVRVLAAGALDTVDPTAAVKAHATAVVCEVLKNPDDQVAYTAASLLGEMRREPEVAVPALAAGLQSTNSLVASSCAYALARYGREGTAAVPALLQAITNGPANLRGTAHQTLKKIDPVAAGQISAK